VSNVFLSGVAFLYTTYFTKEEHWLVLQEKYQFGRRMSIGQITASTEGAGSFFVSRVSGPRTFPLGPMDK
jgi:hypothetical protein